MGRVEAVLVVLAWAAGGARRNFLGTAHCGPASSALVSEKFEALYVYTGEP